MITLSELFNSPLLHIAVLLIFTAIVIISDDAKWKRDKNGKVISNNAGKNS